LWHAGEAVVRCRRATGAEEGRTLMRLRQGDTVAAWLESGVTDGLANDLGDGMDR
jgi:hypothetical protein